MAVFSIVHASDLHLGAEPNRYTSPIEDHTIWAAVCSKLPPRRQSGPARRFAWFLPGTHDEEVFERFADKLTQLESEHGIDLLVLSGDIATTGYKPDLSAALEGVTAPYANPSRPYLTASKKPTLSAREADIVLVPGNHDRYQSRTLRPGGKTFDKVFARYWAPKGLSKSGRVLGRTLLAPGNRDREPQERIDIVCADLSLKSTFDQKAAIGYFGYLGQGRAYRDIVQELVSATKAARTDKPPAPTIWIIHFPPELDPCPGELQLLDERLLVKEASRLKVNFILSGHHHIQHRYRLSTRQTTVMVAGTASQKLRTGTHSFWHLILETKLDKIIKGVATLYQRHDIPGDFAASSRVPL